MMLPKMICPGECVRSLGNIAIARSVVNSGVMAIIIATLTAWVYCKAVFSVMKYREPPVTPARKSKISSFTELDHIRRGDINQMQIYAITNRYTKISVGCSPLPISIFVDTKVVPHIITANMANK